MAADPKRDEINSLAFQLFSQKMATHYGTRRNIEPIAAASYRQAEAFMATRAKYEAGTLNVKPDDGSPKLQDMFCPNLLKTAVLNLVSQKYGDLLKVQRIAAWLQKHYDPKTDDSDGESRAVGLMAKDWPELAWTAADIHTAAALYPAYLPK